MNIVDNNNKQRTSVPLTTASFRAGSELEASRSQFKYVLPTSNNL